MASFTFSAAATGLGRAGVPQAKPVSEAGPLRCADPDHAAELPSGRLFEERNEGRVDCIGVVGVQEVSGAFDEEDLPAEAVGDVAIWTQRSPSG